MTKIRADLVGVVYVGGEVGNPLALAAGDEVPDGAVVGEHLIETGDAPASAPGDDGTPRGNASRDEWAAFAVSKGLAVPEDAKRDDIKALLAEQK